MCFLVPEFLLLKASSRWCIFSVPSWTSLKPGEYSPLSNFKLKMFRCSNKSKLGKVKFDFFLVLTATVESSLIGYTMAMRWPKQFHTASALMILMDKNRGWIGGGRFTHIHWPGQSMVMGVLGGTLLGSQILIWYAAHYPTAFQSKLISQRVFTGHKHPTTQRGHLLMAKDLDVFFCTSLDHVIPDHLTTLWWTYCIQSNKSDRPCAVIRHPTCC